MAADGGLVAWAERSARRRAGQAPVDLALGWLRFLFYGRVSTEDWQDPVTSRARQRAQAEMLVHGHGVIVAPDGGMAEAPAGRCPGRGAGGPGPGLGRDRDR